MTSMTHAAEWNDRARDLSGRDLVGTGSFRLMPDDPMHQAPASGRVEAVAGGWATCITYRWEHPDDGPQEGVLLVASPDDDGGVRATLVDSWHQKPGPMNLTGARDQMTTHLNATYGGDWGWNIIVSLDEAGIRPVMQNVIPEGSTEMAPDGTAIQPGAYDVMDIRLSA